jgi:hypothetical protein
VSLEPGDLVYSIDRGELTVAPIRAVRRVPAHDHVVMRVRLATGATLDVSAPHPTSDGRTFADLGAGSFLDGVEITNVTVIPYEQPYTYDILPDSDTGTYFAAGVLIGSTLARGPAPVLSPSSPLSR